MYRKHVYLLSLLVLMGQPLAQRMRSIEMSLFSGKQFQCGSTNCSSLITTTERNVRRCQMACLSARLCDAASFHQSTSACQLFSHLPNLSGDMLADPDAYSMRVHSDSRLSRGWYGRQDS